MKNTLFISDLHLDRSRPAITQLFLAFLNREAAQADALYILGDLFEAWIGDDNKTEFNEMIFDAIKKISQAGTPIYIMPGNRDFLIGKNFIQQTGCHYLTDPSVINLYGNRVLLMHGDLLCTDDKDYLRFRKIVQNPVIKNLFLCLPLIWRKNIALKLRSRSQMQGATKSSNVMDATNEGVKNIIDKYDVLFLIHGHTHRPSIHYFNHAEKTIRQIVLSDWDKRGNALSIQANGKMKLYYF